MSTPEQQGKASPASAQEAPTLLQPPSAAPDPRQADTLPGAEASSKGGGPESGLERLAPGRTLAGRYTVLEWLGQGSMGLVLAAYDARLDRRVALKLLRPRKDCSGSEAETRLLREAQAMARLTHPHVVSVYDTGTLEDGSLFLAMEYVQGQTLRQWCQQQPRTWREVLSAYLAAGRGLAAAHRAGLVHRDFKPDNVLVGSDGRVLVTDFGLARAEGSPDPADPPSLSSSISSLELLITVPGTLMGTPAYMALELLEGRGADARSDLFAFCASLYEALYGQLPFPSGSMRELCLAQHQGRVAPPPARSEVPAWVARVVLQGLQPMAERRPGSMDVLLEALGDDPEVKRRARTRGAALACAVAVLGGVATWGLVREQRPGCADMEPRLAGVWDEAVRAQVKQSLVNTGLVYAADTAERVSVALEDYAGRWASLSTAVCEAGRARGAQPSSLVAMQEHCLERRRSQMRALTELLARGSDKELVGRAMQAVQALPPLDSCMEAKALTAAAPPPEDPVVRARVQPLQEQVDRLEALHTAGKYKEGLALGEVLLPQAAQVGHAPLQAHVLYLVARLREGSGDYKGAERQLRLAMEAAAQGKDLVMLARATSQLTNLVGYRQGRHQEALLLQPIVEAVVRVADDDLTRAVSFNYLGSVLMREGRFEQAMQGLEQSLALWEKVQGPESPNVASSLNNLGNVLLMMGRYEQARERYERALALWERVLGPEHPDVAASLNNLGNVFHALGQYERARERYERALALWERVLGPEHPEVAASLNNLGSVFHALGRYEQAREHYERALALWERVLGPEHLDVTLSLTGLGRTLVRLRAWDEARGHLQRSLGLQRKVLGPEHPDLAETLLGLGELSQAQGRPTEALPWLERALRLAQSDARAEVHLALAHALWETRQDRPRALALATQAREHWRRLGHVPRLAEVSRWLATHGPGEPRPR